MSEEQIVVFHLGAEEYGISISKVKEIIVYNGVTRLPNSPDFVEGIINLRGRLISIIDLNKRFKIKGSSTSNKQAIIVEVYNKEIGILVDGVTEVLKLSEQSINSMPTITTNINTEYVQGIATVNDRLLIMLDIEKLFQPEELAAVG